MASSAALDAAAVDAFLAGYRTRELVRLLTCGSVDDGKSTLIGRLLYDARGVFEDQLAEAASRTRRNSAAAGPIDLSLLLDGLEAEREQGITIDVAHRFFTTEKRKFILADAPGHVQYTRNMATAASRADLAVILVDATRGVREQTRRHAFLAALLGIKHLVVAVNKMDLVDWSARVFEQVRQDSLDMLVKLGVRDVHWIPLSALHGDNVVRRSEHMPWYAGMPLLEHLETVHIASDLNRIDMRFSVEHVVRSTAGFRGYAGTVVSGAVRPGDPVVVLPSGQRTRIQGLVGVGGEVAEACAPMAVTVTLQDETDVTRGDLLAPPDNAPRLETTCEAMLVWMDAQAMVPGKEYLLRHLARHLTARVTAVRYRVNLGSLHREPAATLELNEIGRVTVTLPAPLAHDPYTDNRATGAFILIDRASHATVAAGTIVARRQVGRAEPPAVDLAPDGTTARDAQATAGTVWLSGLPASGKSTIGRELHRALALRGVPALRLDAAELQGSVWAGTPAAADPRHAALATARLCRLANASGLVAIVAIPSGDVADRVAARELAGSPWWCEAWCEASLPVCQARAGPARDLTGTAGACDPPGADAIRLPTEKADPGQCAQLLLAELERRGWLRPPARAQS